MDIASLIARQRAFFQTGSTRPVSFRRRQLRILHDALESHEATLLDALHADLRKPAMEAYTAEIGFLLSEIRYALRHVAQWAKPRRRGLPLFSWPGRAMLCPEPRGLVLILGPWNYPVQLLLSPLVGADRKSVV